ncbi:uncharacterized protein BCR38DRAFT_332861 [Pseudomassariella vexata]|uniref:Uncharacterized protein n=1 Tax=Pseudomassariella vexata TaxID=1141098 RepID=A0A1Y2EFW5_9PEZI|nr:uncharacterized protein BCR38DRAFT_332861 [Pseudomassariella vexata]ORY70459.1 hypothetical protein BCR38DRAFT_332861 [Pseudomassariella vexata]
MDGEVSILPKRQSSVNLTDDSSSLNSTAWNTETAAACMAALAPLTTASNPSGTAVCYNLQSLDTSTGAFMADLRLFQVSTPYGDFTGIPPQNIQVGLQYHGASVSPVSQSSVSSRDLETRATTPTQLQVYMFVGQIDQAQLSQPMTMGVVEALVMPVVTLNAVNGAGTAVSTNVSSNEAAFVNGVFSQDVVLSDLALAQVAVNDITTALANGTVAFILPGVNILIFPVGLVMTATWTFIGVAAYGYGTFQRIGYRESYRRRQMRITKPAASARI